MTPEELHSRILLHEIRTILLDPSRQGDQLPQEQQDFLNTNPHNPDAYLVLADWLDDQGSDLAELTRIQAELIDIIPPAFLASTKNHWNQHPFHIHGHSTRGHLGKLLTRRSELIDTLYPRKQGLGRTTRMLTDALRYCVINQDTSRVLVLHERPDYARGTLLDLAGELFELSLFNNQQPSMTGSLGIISLYGTTVDFSRLKGHKFDVTFVDHGVPTPRPQALNQLTCIGGPLHGQQQTIRNDQRFFEYPEMNNDAITWPMHQQEPIQDLTYTIHTYRPERWFLPNARQTTQIREYLVHESLNRNQAWDRIYREGIPDRP